MSGQSKSSRALVACCLALAACTATQDDGRHAAAVTPDVEPEAPVGPPDAGPPPAPALWTEAFKKSGMLLANTIAIEGPVGLIDHVAVRSDDALYVRSAKTTAEGFVQTVRARQAGELVRGQLDGWQLAAFQTLTILERPGASAVRVTATGEAVWRDPLGKEQRDAKLEFTGELSAAVE